MIKNERQYRITRAAAKRFQSGLKEINSRESTETLNSWEIDIQRDAIETQLSDLKSQLREYELLKTQQLTSFKTDSLDELGIVLIKARIASGLSQRDLASKMGLKEQQIQRYESSEYSTASLDRLKEVVSALNLDIRKEILLREIPISVDGLFERLKKAGLSKTFVQNKLLTNPMRDFLEQLKSGTIDDPQFFVLKLASHISRIFNWTTEELLNQNVLLPPKELALSTQYRRASSVRNTQASIFVVYAHYLSLLSLQCTPHLIPKGLSQDSSEVRTAILDEYGTIELDSILSFIWGCGIAVLPLRDPGKFYGACWKINGRPVMVLKQRTSSQARWMIDALHEFYHLSQKSDSDNMELIEHQEYFEENDSTIDKEEKNATWFAVNVLLDDKAEELVEECVSTAKNRVEYLKGIVPSTAARHGVDKGVLANYLAYRLSMQGINWWGTAQNLQSSDIDPWKLTRDFYLDEVDLSELNEGDRDMIMKALSSEE